VAAHAVEWLGPLLPLSGDGHQDREFNRGIKEWWYTTAGNFLKKAHQRVVCEWFPRLGLKLLMLVDPSKRVGAVAASPALEWVVELTWLRARLGDDGFRALAASPHTHRLSRLVVEKPRCGDSRLHALARSISFPNLKAIGLRDGLWGSTYTAAGLLGLLRSARLPKLDELDLSDAQGGGVEWGTLFADPAVRRLRRLRLGWGVDLDPLAACPHLTDLEACLTDSARLTEAGAIALADNPAFARLTFLQLLRLNPDRSPLGGDARRRLQERFGPALDLR
jgi:hypothetical protein